MEILSPEPSGAFLVRCSESRPDAFALSLRVPNRTVVHYLVISNCHGWKIKVSIRIQMEEISASSSAIVLTSLQLKALTNCTLSNNLSFLPPLRALPRRSPP